MAQLVQFLCRARDKPKTIHQIYKEDTIWIYICLQFSPNHTSLPISLTHTHKDFLTLNALLSIPSSFSISSWPCIWVLSFCQVQCEGTPDAPMFSLYLVLLKSNWVSVFFYWLYRFSVGVHRFWFFFLLILSNLYQNLSLI